MFPGFHPKSPLKGHTVTGGKIEVSMSLETQNLFLLEIYEMCAGIYDKKISIIFYQNLLKKVKVNLRTQVVLGLTF